MSELGRQLSNRLRYAVFGREGLRIRATWRVLMAWPLLPVVGSLVALVMPVLGLRGMIPGGPLQGIIFLGILVLWAGFIDRRSLAEYGVSLSAAWAQRLLLGFAVVVGVWSAWHGIAIELGWMRIEWSMSAPQGDVGLRLIGALVSLAINTWVQDVVFFSIVLVAAAQGLRSRDINPRRAVLGGWLVAGAFFTAIHGTPTALDFSGTLVSGLVFGLLYAHTGELALTIGVHWGSSYAAGFVFPRVSAAQQGASIFQVTELGPLAKGMEVPLVLYPVTYLLLVLWIRLISGDLSIETELVEWTAAESGMVETIDPRR
jgi:membrane protease YdiL (CAAX protease family)